MRNISLSVSSLLFVLLSTSRKWNYARGENVKVYSLVYDVYSSHISKVDSEDSSALSSTGTEERTLAMIKPDGLSGNHTDQIKIIILESRFNIVSEKMFQLDAESAAIFYAEHSGRSFFPSLIKYMTSGPVYIMILEKSDAISHWRALIGPTDARKAKVTHPNSMRAICGSDSQRNCVHGSDSPQSAAREISFFFGELSTGISTHDEL